MNLQSPKEKDLNKKIDTLNVELNNVRSNKLICCPICTKRTKLKNATIISEHGYVRPYSCNGGDYWTFSEYIFYCNKCNNFNRAYIGSADKIKYSGGNKISNILPDSLKKPRVNLYIFIEEYFYYFGEKLNSFEDNLPIDQLREKNIERKRQ